VSFSIIARHRLHVCTEQEGQNASPPAKAMMLVQICTRSLSLPIPFVPSPASPSAIHTLAFYSHRDAAKVKPRRNPTTKTPCYAKPKIQSRGSSSGNQYSLNALPAHPSPQAHEVEEPSTLPPTPPRLYLAIPLLLPLTPTAQRLLVPVLHDRRSQPHGRRPAAPRHAGARAERPLVAVAAQGIQRHGIRI